MVVVSRNLYNSDKSPPPGEANPCLDLAVPNPTPREEYVGLVFKHYNSIGQPFC